MDKKLAGLIGLFFVGFVVFVSLIVFGKPIARLTRAENTVVSSARSLMFAWPLKAKANGSESVSVDVFIRSNNNIPIANKEIVLLSTLGTVSAGNAVSDSSGKATFIVKSSSPGTARITASVGSTRIDQSLSVVFE